MDRLDIYISKKYNISRQKAQELIKNEKVFVNDGIQKSSYKVKDSDIIDIINYEFDFVSRGGLKLLKAIQKFELSLENKIALDIGASTGGFTDCMLFFGAKKVYAVDVGTNQLAHKLLNDKRVINIENMNIKNLTSDDLEEAVDFITMDLSFISLTKVLWHIKKFLKDDGDIICLIKPQFEAGKNNISKGIVKNKKIHKSIIDNLIDYFKEIQLYIYNFTYSPIVGQKGNIEYLVHLKKEKKEHDFNVESIVEEAFLNLRRQ